MPAGASAGRGGAARGQRRFRGLRPRGSRPRGTAASTRRPPTRRQRTGTDAARPGQLRSPGRERRPPALTCRRMKLVEVVLPSERFSRLRRVAVPLVTCAGESGDVKVACRPPRSPPAAPRSCTHRGHNGEDRRRPRTSALPGRECGEGRERAEGGEREERGGGRRHLGGAGRP